MTKHTPGPWAITETPSAPKTEHVAIGTWGSAQVFGDDVAANARLIAAAPDLLEALKGCRQYLYVCATEERKAGRKTTAAIAEKDLQILDAIVAKAEGTK